MEHDKDWMGMREKSFRNLLGVFSSEKLFYFRMVPRYLSEVNKQRNVKLLYNPIRIIAIQRLIIKVKISFLDIFPIKEKYRNYNL